MEALGEQSYTVWGIRLMSLPPIKDTQYRYQTYHRPPHQSYTVWVSDLPPSPPSSMGYQTYFPPHPSVTQYMGYISDLPSSPLPTHQSYKVWGIKFTSLPTSHPSPHLVIDFLTPLFEIPSDLRSSRASSVSLMFLESESEEAEAWRWGGGAKWDWFILWGRDFLWLNFGSLRGNVRYTT